MKFDDEIEIQSLIDKILKHQPHLLPDTPITAGVIILLLTTSQHHIEIPLTKRADTLPFYAGHYSLPGGIRDIEDVDLYQTAQRELLEELNISPEQYQYVGQLNDMLTHDGNLVRPYVVMMPKSIFENIFKLSVTEIASIYFLQIKKLCEFKDEPKLHSITRRRPSYVFKENDVYVWGLTASILVHLSEVIK